MTAFLIALVPGVLALLPILLAPRRRRSLALLRAEVDLLNELPEELSARWEINEVVSEGASRYFDRYISSDPSKVRTRRVRHALWIAYAVAISVVVLSVLESQLKDDLGWSRGGFRVVVLGLTFISTVSMAVAVVTFIREVVVTRSVPNPLHIYFGLHDDRLHFRVKG